MASLNIAGVPTLPSNTSGFNRSRRSSWSDSKNVWNVGDEAENYSDSHTLILKKLDIHYHKVKRQILAFQSLTTGLFPTHLDTDKKVAHVVENIFCSIAVWSLRQCYCKIDNDQGRAHELGQAAVKCMRGILNCWMKQAKKYVEIFKSEQSPMDALHSKFNVFDGSEIEGADEVDQLQICAISIYLLTIVQMITSNLQFNCALNTISPNEIKQLLYYVLTTNLQQSTLQGGDIDQRSSFQKRQMDGALSRVPTNFYEHVWSILERAPKGIQLCSILLPQQPTLSDMTDYELNFSLKIEEMLGRLLDPVNRCLVVEMFESINVLLQRNPELCFVQPLDVDYLISDAVKLFEQQTKSLDSLKDFYNLPISLVGGSTGYMIQVVNDDSPIIDLSPLRDSSSSGLSKVAQEFTHAFQGIGFVYIISHHVPQSITDQIFAQHPSYQVKSDSKSKGTLVEDTKTVVKTSNQSESFIINHEHFEGPFDLKKEDLYDQYLQDPNQ
ncbi:unnamed protein product [Rotaria magnacalcarata]|uniref:Phosphorylase b kinase regulatory subunit n=1 Tax=Rotaria magnacalcarata TaxID=392030 RepID=A0A8S2NRK5_9BILA|nr:unnamed protein product [Rotaria magnacalcarata]CAF4042907.1 unnamed protein product [Rotaria magnacalcarata]